MLPDFAAWNTSTSCVPPGRWRLFLWLVITLMQNRRQTSRDMFGGIIARTCWNTCACNGSMRAGSTPPTRTRFSVLLLVMLMGDRAGASNPRPEPG